MLKNNKSFENFDCVNNKQLFAELSPEEGSAISGGFDYTIANRTDIRIPIVLGGQQRAIEPLTDLVYQSNINQVVIVYDETIGPGFDVVATVLKPGLSGFDRDGNKLLLITSDQGGLPVPTSAMVGEGI